MKTNKGTAVLKGFGIVAMGALLAGCPPYDTLIDDLLNPPPTTGGGNAQAEYDAGFDEGFAEDDWYWTGYDDSTDTVDAGPIYYQGSDIPYVDDLSNDAGYWDGVWYAYNDGYFVAYDYAFTIGFSEGYDVFFTSAWYDLLLDDEHLEFLDGGFSDGYNDGFSEGRILGATDYEQGLPYDWLDAMAYYREGNDLYIEELDLGTGEYGPVYLYEYGTDPLDLVKSDKAKRNRSGRAAPSIRRDPSKAEVPDLSYRSLPQDVRTRLNVKPAVSSRGKYALKLTTSWLDRIDAYLALQKKDDPLR